MQLDTAAAILAESKHPVVIAKVNADKFRHLGDKYEIKYAFMLFHMTLLQVLLLVLSVNLVVINFLVG